MPVCKQQKLEKNDQRNDPRMKIPLRLSKMVSTERVLYLNLITTDKIASRTRFRGVRLQQATNRARNNLRNSPAYYIQ